MFLMFYNAYAKSIIPYGLLIYGAAAKTNLSRIESVQRRTLRAFFFQKTTRFLARNTCCEQNQYCLRAFLERNGF